MKSSRLFLILANIVLFVPLIIFSGYGLFSRYIADDFCTAAYVRSMGLLSSMELWRRTWSGRFSFYFFMDITQLIGPWITPFITAITLLTWLIALFFLASSLFRAFRIPGSKLAALLFASIVLVSTLYGAPDIYQSLYWQTGIVTYVYPLILFTILAAFLLHRLSKKDNISWIDIALCAGLAWVAGGFSETYVAAQTVSLTALILIVFIYTKGETRGSSLKLLAGGLLGSLLALALVVTAPGNAVRMTTMPDQINSLELIISTIRYTLTFPVKSFLNAPFSFLISLVVPGLIAFMILEDPVYQKASPAILREKYIPYLVWIPIISAVIIASCIAPSVYATAAYPAERALVTTQFILVSAVASWSFILGIALRPRFSRDSRVFVFAFVVIVLLLVASVVLSSQKTLSTLPDAQTYAALWDQRDQKARQAAASGIRDVSVASLPHISPGLAELSTDSNDWVNQCFALYYDLPKVTGK